MELQPFQPAHYRSKQGPNKNSETSAKCSIEMKPDPPKTTWSNEGSTPFSNVVLLGDPGFLFWSPFLWHPMDFKFDWNRMLRIPVLLLSLCDLCSPVPPLETLGRWENTLNQSCTLSCSWGSQKRSSFFSGSICERGMSRHKVVYRGRQTQPKHSNPKQWNLNLHSTRLWLRLRVGGNSSGDLLSTWNQHGREMWCFLFGWWVFCLAFAWFPLFCLVFCGLGCPPFPLWFLFG